MVLRISSCPLSETVSKALLDTSAISASTTLPSPYAGTLSNTCVADLAAFLAASLDFLANS